MAALGGSAAAEALPVEERPEIKRVGIVFAGGPAPGANSVISVAASSLRRLGIEVVGIMHGYSTLVKDTRPLVEGEHYMIFESRDLWGLRNSRGIVIGTSRTGPGRGIKTSTDLDDPSKTGDLKNVYNSLMELKLDAIISIGGDGTLRTANYVYEYQKRLPPDAKRVRVVHVPKTIDNDYSGIDFTFGFFTAVGTIAEELQNLRADAMCTQSYFVVETMGRTAGWLAYGASIAGEAHMVVACEDVVGPLATHEVITNPVTGETHTDIRLDLDALADRIVDLILTRAKSGKTYGCVVLAEGIAEMLPEKDTSAVRNESGQVSLAQLDLSRLVARKASARYLERVGTAKKITGVQLGYESRCAAPHAFDVVLGSQLGLGAGRCLTETKLDGVMVSVTGQLDLRYVPFGDLIDSKTLSAQVRLVKAGGDFHRLAQEICTRVPPGPVSP